MKKTGDLLRFLFVDSQAQDELDDYLLALQEEMDRQEDLEGKSAPLRQALEKAEVSLKDMELELDPEEGWCLTTACPVAFKAAVARLSSPEGMHALASADWAASSQGDLAATQADGSYRIVFTEISGNEEPSDIEKADDMEKIAKDSFDFVNEPMPALKDKARENKFTAPKGKPMGKAASGAKPKKA